MDHGIKFVLENVGVYDSVYSVIEEDTKDVILSLFQLPDNP